jgi:hypothetical protein
MHNPSSDQFRRAEAAVWGPKPASPTNPERPKMTLVEWRPIRKNSLRGFATIRLPIGLKINDCLVLVSHGKAWATLPSKPLIDKDGRHKADTGGKPSYVPVLEWCSRDLADRFSDAVVALVRAEHPGDLLGGTP